MFWRGELIGLYGIGVAVGGSGVDVAVASIVGVCVGRTTVLVTVEG